MGFLQNIEHSLNPKNLLHPKETFVNSLKASADPGGTFIRTGRGVKQTLNNTIDPMNAVVAAPPDPTTPFQNPMASRGMFMGPQGPTVNLPNNTSRVYAPNPFQNKPPGMSLGGSAGGQGVGNSSPLLPGPVSAPPPMQPRPMPVMDDTKYLISSLRNGRPQK